MSYHLIPADTNAQLDVFEDQGVQPLVAHIWRKEKNGFYGDPQWCSERLYEDEPFVGSQWAPFCGIGRCSDAVRRCGYKTYATDIVDRGYQHFDRTLNFPLCEGALGNNIVTNPPFQICDQALRHSLKLHVDAIAMIWLARRLNAAHWLADTPLARVYMLTPRTFDATGPAPSMGGRSTTTPAQSRYELNTAITTIREKHGPPPIDDGVPGEPDTPYPASARSC